MVQQHNMETVVIEELISMSTTETAVLGHTLMNPWSTSDFRYPHVILNSQFSGPVPVNLLTISYPINVVGRTYTRQGVFLGGPSPVDIRKGVLSPSRVLDISLRRSRRWLCRSLMRFWPLGPSKGSPNI